MYCIECGKANPDQAKFCAFCGHRLLELGDQQAPRPDEAPKPTPAPPKPQPAKPAPPKPQPAKPDPVKAEPVKPEPVKPDPHIAYKRPMDGANVRPLADNPAQPSKNHAPAAPESSPAERPQEKPAPAAPRQQENKAVTSSGGRVTLPSRAPNVKRAKRYGEVTHRAPTASPFKQAQQNGAMPFGHRRAPEEDDLFFEDIGAEDDFDIEEDKLSKHLRWIIAVLFLVLVLSAVSWLFFSSGGQVFLASIGMNASAVAYETLGDQSSEKGELKRAAEAYHGALRRDPNNYAYALKTGKAYQRIGDDEKAYAAYNVCIELDANASEPYRLLAEMLEKQGGTQAGEQMRQLGYEKTGDQSLLDKGGSAG